VPEFFVIGHHKSGTTALYEILRRHPQIYLPKVKEPRFFDTDLHDLIKVHGPGGLPTTREDYLALFADARPDQVVGEASPSYLRSTVAARAIAEMQPAARCIAIFREPASFVRSLHLQMVQEHVEHETDFAKAVASEEILRGDRHVLRYSDHVHYVEQLRRFDAVFPPEQMLVLVYDDFRRDNESTVRRVLRFLDVDDTVPIEAIEANPTVRVRSLRADRALRGLYAGRNPLARALKGSVGAAMPRRVRVNVNRFLRRRLVYGKPAPVQETVTRDLRRRYRDEVVALGDYLGRDLVKLWRYDELD
jgi:hypothetical protein